jgi:ParB family chromosome partitioning protein
MAIRKKALGRGIEALIPSSLPQPLEREDIAETDPAQAGPVVRMVSTTTIIPNPNQPRHFFDEARLAELADSIRTQGILQPLLLRSVEGRLELVAGERRWRAAQLAGLDSVPALIEDCTNRQQLERALIENLQREELNAMEESRAYQELISAYGLSQEEVSRQVGKARATVANSLRLLRLPPAIQRDIEAGRISAGHARAILSLEGEEKQRRLHRAILADSLSVRAAEDLARRIASPQPPRPASPLAESDPQVKAIEEKITEALGVPTRVKPTGPTSGRIEIQYLSLDDLDRVLAFFEIDTSL